ncbi:MAG TPA: hypothetical protein DDW27_21730 [Bacteroidales bacterium]|nr:hypothetical protein [Bacteroidales bacterium]
MKSSLRIIIISIALSSEAFSQQTAWQAGLYSFFDNTEFGQSLVQIPQTMAGVRFAPGFCLKFDSVHSIVAGVNMLHEYGSHNIIDNVTPTAYYMYRGDPLRFIAGAFPRDFALDRYPRLFFRDSLTYYRPNMNGILLDYSHAGLSANLWLDWTSRQSFEHREAFFVGFSGRYERGIFYVQQFSYMFHFAGIKDPAIDEALHDNIMLLASAGFDLSEKTIFDRLEFNAGYVTGLDRARGDNTGWLIHNGFLSETYIEYRRFGLFNTFYAGEGQMSFYRDHNNELYWGDPFYRTNTYNRSDLYLDFLRNDIVNARLLFSFHFTERNVYNEQALKISVNLNNIRLKH